MNIETVRFTDDDTAQEALIIIRVATQKVGLCISLENDGDIEVMIPISQCESIIQAMKVAITHIRALSLPPRA